MVRPSCKHKKEMAIALYMPTAREVCGLTPLVEKELKSTIKEVGGDCNGSGLFLATTSTASIVSKLTGVNRRSVMFIPRCAVDSDLLECLDKGTTNFRLYLHYTITSLLCMQLWLHFKKMMQKISALLLLNMNQVSNFLLKGQYYACMILK